MLLGNSSDGTAAGIWGDYLCDVSNATLINLFEFLRNMSDEFDWIYWTGDLIAHYVWSQTRTDTVCNSARTPSIYGNHSFFFVVGRLAVLS